MDAALDYRPMVANEESLIAFADCFERNGTPRRLDALRWQYGENPADETLVDLALEGEHIAAIYAVQPAIVRVRGAHGRLRRSLLTPWSTPISVGAAFFRKWQTASTAESRSVAARSSTGFRMGTRRPASLASSAGCRSIPCRSSSDPSARPSSRRNCLSAELQADCRTYRFRSGAPRSSLDRSFAQ